MGEKFIVTLEVEGMVEAYIQELTRDVSEITFDHFEVTRVDIQQDAVYEIAEEPARGPVTSWADIKRVVESAGYSL